MSSPHLPRIAIVGRPNVGKSSLFNMLAGRMISIVDPTAGVTRDRISSIVQLPSPDDVPHEQREPDKLVEIIDTGGFGIKDPQIEQLSTMIERQIAIAVSEANLILFIVDAQTGVVALDQAVAKLIRESLGKNDRVKVMIVANKVDSSALMPAAMDATRLGFGTPVLISATTGYNKNELLRAIRSSINFNHFADAPTTVETGPLLAIIGKRNAGKSTLVNALAGTERVIVSEFEGTTRDSIDVRFEIGGKVFTAIDTAGVRKRKSLADDLEFYSHHRALRSLRRADVALLLIDATLPVSQVDAQLGNELLRHFKPTIIVVNKWDLAQEKHTKEQYIEYLDESLKGLNFAPVAFISAAKGEGVRDLIAMAMNLHQQAGHHVGTAELNKLVEQVVAEKPPSSKLGHRLKIFYVTQPEVHPPTIALFVNQPDMFDPTYQRYLINRFREFLPYSEVPIKLLIRSRRPASDQPQQ